MSKFSILHNYLAEKPLFLSLLRAKEAFLYQKHLPLRGPVLDFGCGDGFFTKVAIGKADIGLDTPESRIGEIDKEDKVYKKIVEYDGKIIPFTNGYFGAVVSNSVLEHVANLDFSLSEISRVLKKGGIFIAPVMAKPWEDNLLGTKLLGNGYARWLRKTQEHVNLFTEKEWRRAFEKHGFKIIEEKGHLTPNNGHVLEIAHYLSIPSLISYKLLGRWTITGKNLWPTKWLVNLFDGEVSPEKSGAIFFVLKKVG